VSDPGIEINSAISSISRLDLSFASSIVYLFPIRERKSFAKFPFPGSFRVPPYFLEDSSQRTLSMILD